MAAEFKRRPASQAKPSLTASGNRAEHTTASGDRTGRGGVLVEFAELREYVRHYVDAKLDSLRLSVRLIALGLVLGVLGLFAAFGAIVAAVWLLLNGLAGGIAELLGNRPWAGNLTVGCVLILGVGLALFFGVSRWKHRWLERTMAKYEARQDEQRARFGRDVSDQAASADE